MSEMCERTYYSYCLTYSMVHGRKLACSSSILTHKAGCTSAKGQRCLAKPGAWRVVDAEIHNYDCALLVFQLGATYWEMECGRGTKDTTDK